MINSQDIKKGTCIRMDGKLYFCIDFLHRKPGKGNTIMNVTLKDVVNGGVLERRFNVAPGDCSRGGVCTNVVTPKNS